jgi:hypothetical protein
MLLKLFYGRNRVQIEQILARDYYMAEGPSETSSKRVQHRTESTNETGLAVGGHTVWQRETRNGGKS